ncbi:DUF3618 domain-containing protein [Streptomyces sp. NPDC046939]|uniref:DUF3618 domain-containing protein n=1 Tax=Streptomyces sp. NPDC046939 TaxID=3155376 RepID=UPI0033CAFF3A
MTQPPHDEPTATSTEELREQVEQTRHELGDTVQALADKADVKARTQEKAAALKEQTAAKASELSATTAAKASELTAQAKAKAEQAQQVWQDKAPEPVRDKRAMLIAAGVALVTVIALARRKKK